LKARPLQKWAVVLIAGVQYAEASLVTKGGSLWVATTTTTTTPGESGGDWRLIVNGDMRNNDDPRRTCSPARRAACGRL
jgi:hypothetical protein